MEKTSTEGSQSEPEKPAPTPAVNDNDPAPPNAVSLTELASLMQVSEDVLLERLAGILSKREANVSDTEPPE